MYRFCRVFASAGKLLNGNITAILVLEELLLLVPVAITVSC